MNKLTSEEMSISLRRQLIRDAAYIIPLRGDTLEEINHNYCYSLLPGRYTFAIFLLSSNDSARIDLFKREVSRELADILPHFPNEVETLFLQDKQFLFFDLPDECDCEIEWDFKNELQQICFSLNKYMIRHGCIVNVAIGSAVNDISLLPNSMVSARVAGDYFLAKDSLQGGLSDGDNLPVLDDSMSDTVITATRRKALQDCIEVLNYEQIDLWIEHAVETLYCKSYQTPSLMQLAHHILRLIYAYVINLVCVYGFYDDELEEAHQAISECKSRAEVVEQLKKYAKRLLKPYSDYIERSDRLPVLEAKRYLHKNFSGKIRLDDAAKEAHLSPQYFSMLFKRETGMTFTQYLTDIRINAAKLLLRDSFLSIQEIAAEVGYDDAKYFSRIFRKSEGCLPQEYRACGSLGPDAKKPGDKSKISEVRPDDYVTMGPAAESYVFAKELRRNYGYLFTYTMESRD